MKDEEKLKKEAIAKYKTGSYPQLHPDIRAFIHGYLAGAEPREKRIEELEVQIEKMKCCQNCVLGKSCEKSGLVYVCEKWRFEK